MIIIIYTFSKTFLVIIALFRDLGTFKVIILVLCDKSNCFFNNILLRDLDIILVINPAL